MCMKMMSPDIINNCPDCNYGNLIFVGWGYYHILILLLFQQIICQVML